MPVHQTTPDGLAAMVGDGALVALPVEYSFCSMETIRALVRRGVRGLHILGVPTFGLQADLLVGAGCVAVVETSAVTLGEHGLAPRFTAACKAGTIAVKDATCPAIHAALQAAEKGAPFMPLRGIIGSDLLARRKDWAVIDNPFAADDPVVCLPAIRPDVAVFHAPMADRDGNVWVGLRRELMLMAHAAQRTLVTVERFTDQDLLADAATAAGTLPALYVSAVAEAVRGAWPLGAFGLYGPDSAHLAAYAAAARSQEGFDAYLDEFVHHREAAE